MEIKIKKMYAQDCTAIFISMAALWLVLGYVMTRVSAIVPDQTVRIIILLVGIVAGTFGTASSIAVLVHLKKNQRSLYIEEITSYRDKSKHT